MKYCITLNDLSVGYAEMYQDGLYYRIRCFCNISEKNIYRIYLKTDSDCINLGICIPEGGSYKLERRIPIKQVPCNNVHFIIESTLKTDDDSIIPIDPNIPFTHPEKIKDGKFVAQGRRVGIIVKERLTTRNIP